MSTSRVLDRAPSLLFALVAALVVLTCGGGGGGVGVGPRGVAALLAYFAPSAGRLYSSPLAEGDNQGFNSSLFNYTIGVPMDTEEIWFDAAVIHSRDSGSEVPLDPEQSSFKYRYTTGGVASDWIDMFDFIPIDPLLRPAWSIGDLLFEVSVNTTMLPGDDGSMGPLFAPDEPLPLTTATTYTVVIYSFRVECDEPILLREDITANLLPVVLGNMGNPDEFIVPAEGGQQENTIWFHLWPFGLGRSDWELSVSKLPPGRGGSRGTCPGTRFGFFVGQYDRQEQPNDGLRLFRERQTLLPESDSNSPPLPDSGDGSGSDPNAPQVLHRVPLPLVMGAQFLYLIATNPAGRTEAVLWDSQPPLHIVDIRMPASQDSNDGGDGGDGGDNGGGGGGRGDEVPSGPPTTPSLVYDLHICPPFDPRVYAQSPCNLPRYTPAVRLDFPDIPWNAPPCRIYLNGALVLSLPRDPMDDDYYTGEDGGLFPVVEGVNSYLIAQPTGNYSGQIVVPRPGGFAPFFVRVRASAATVVEGQHTLWLEAELATDRGGEPSTRGEDLVWEWSAVPYVNFSDPRQVRPRSTGSSSSSNQTLLLSQRFVSLQPNTTYVFTVRALDSPTRRDAEGQIRTANSSVHVRVQPRVEVLSLPTPAAGSAPSKAPPTPCELANPCLNGGRCSFVPAAANATLPQDDEQQPAKFVRSPVDGKEYALYCACPQASPQFFGPTCDFAILQCLRCTARFDGGSGQQQAPPLTLLGVGLVHTLDMHVGGVPVPVQGMRTVNASDGEEVVAVLKALNKAGLQYTSLTALTFLAPPLLNSTAADNATSVDILPQFRSYSQSQPLPLPRRVRSAATYLGDDLPLDLALDPATGRPIDTYVPLSVSAILPGARVETVLQFRTLLFYTSSACLAEGEFRPDGRGGCTPCPAGSYCPGAGRVWPYPGYYGYSEYTAPAECRVEEACAGMDMQLASGGSAAGTRAYFAAGNEENKCTLGYRGAKCSECTEGYFQLQSHCYLCDESVDQSGQLTLTLLAVLVLAAFLSVCVALLSTEMLCAAIGHILMAQTIATIGVSGAPSLPAHAESVATFFTWMDLINFNLGLLRPGCGGVPTFTFVTKFFSTMLFMLLVAVLFFVACCVRYYIQRRRWNQLMSAPLAVRLRPRVSSTVGVEADKNKDEDEFSSEEGTVVKKEDKKKDKKGKEEEEDEEDEGPPLPPDRPRHDFKKRLEHSYLILLALMYLRVTTLLCENFLCLTQPEPVTPSTASNAVIEEELLLDADGSTRCYVTGHAASTAVAIIVIVVYMIGFPLFCFVRLLRAFGSEDTVGLSGWAWRRWAFLRGSHTRDRTKFQHTLDLWTADNAAAKLENEKQQQRQQAGGKAHAQAQAKQVVDPAASSAVESSAAEAEAAVALIKAENDAMLDRLLERDRSDRFGFLYDGLTGRNVTFVVHMLLIQALFAVVGVFLTRDVMLQLFLFNVLTVLDGLHTAYALPWEGFRENIKVVTLGGCGLVQGVVLIGTQEDGTSSPYFGVSVALGALLPLVLFLRRNSKARRIADGIEEQDDKVDAESTKGAGGGTRTERTGTGKAASSAPGVVPLFHEGADGHVVTFHISVPMPPTPSSSPSPAADASAVEMQQLHSISHPSSPSQVQPSPAAAAAPLSEEPAATVVGPAMVLVHFEHE